jgi:hypothetical protein
MPTTSTASRDDTILRLLDLNWSSKDTGKQNRTETCSMTHFKSMNAPTHGFSNVNRSRVIVGS